MAQVIDRTVGANPSGFDMRIELNNIIAALESDNSGSSEPLNTVAYMKWLDTSDANYYYYKERNHDNTAWVTLFRYTVATKIMEAVSNEIVLQDTAIEIHASTSKDTPIDNDEIGLLDSASTFTLKKLTWANLKATLKNYFDTLYVALTGNQTINGTKTFGSFPLTPSSAPTTDYQVANKKFVLDSVATITVPDATSSVKGIDYKSLLAEYTVSGSAVTSIDFSGLDINTHKSYRVEIETVTNGGSYILMFVNGDTTVTNYYSQQLITASTTTTSLNSNTPRTGYQGTEDLSSLTNINITKATNGLVVFNSMSCGDRNEGSLFFGRKTATVANVTQLTFTQTGANGFGVGSKIRIYRGDV